MSLATKVTSVDLGKINKLAQGIATKPPTFQRYKSKVRLPTVLSGAGPYTYTIAAATLATAFGYTVGQDMASAGRPGTTATIADTNISTAGQTAGAGESVLVKGISMVLSPDSDPLMAMMVDAYTSVTLVVNGQSRNFLGNPSSIPGIGGLVGNGNSQIVTPALGEGLSRGIGCLTNGLPHQDNFYEFPESFFWTGLGGATSNLKVEVQCQSAVTNIVNTNTADRAAAAGVAAWTHPAAAGVFVQWDIYILGVSVSPA